MRVEVGDPLAAVDRQAAQRLQPAAGRAVAERDEVSAPGPDLTQPLDVGRRRHAALDQREVDRRCGRTGAELGKVHDHEALGECRQQSALEQHELAAVARGEGVDAEPQSVEVHARSGALPPQKPRAPRKSASSA
jgi:hypothetical protein